MEADGRLLEHLIMQCFCFCRSVQPEAYAEADDYGDEEDSD